MEVIESRDNKVFKKLKSLQKKKGLLKEGQALLSGSKVIADYQSSAFGQSQASQARWILSSHHDLQSTNRDKNQTVFSPTLFAELDQFGTGKPLLQIPIPQIHPINELNTKRPTLFFCLGNPKNAGTFLRTALAFGINQVVLCEEACFPFLPESLRASSGYALQMAFFQGPSVHDLKALQPLIDPTQMVALDLGGKPLHQTPPWPHPLHLLIGEEGPGIPNSFPGHRFTIPLMPPVESLNASVAAGIGLYQWFSQKDKDS